MTSRATATVLFTDLVGSTELRGRLGEEAADELRRVHDRLLTQAVERNGGRVLKGLGDGIMASFTGAADAVAAAVAVQQAVDRLNHSGEVSAPLAVRVGLSAGDVAFEDDDIHGIPVIEASRLCAAAEGGAILAAEVVRILAGAVGGHTYTTVGPLELKGLDHPVHAIQVAWEPISPAGVPIPSLLTDVGRVFVGRDSELERMKLRWKDAVAGERRVVLLGGEPGVGKTRLAAAMAAFASEEGGGVVLAGRCDEDLGVPYQPFVEALRHFMDHAPPDRLRDRLGRYGGELARLLPEVAELLPDLAPPLRSDPETERYRLFDAVAGWVSAVSAEQPVLLVLDDLQWAAKPTLLLLRHVLHAAEPLRLLVVATYRDTDIGRGHPLGELLADLRRDTGVERIALSGLTMAGVVGYLEAASGHAVHDEDDTTALALAIHDETDGNPFFIREVLRHLVETGGIAERDGRWSPTVDVDQLGIPEGVRDVVGRRLSRLSDRANQVLTAAAVIGTAFDVAVVGRVCGLDDDDLLTALEEAEAARIVAEVPSSIVPRYRFAHRLVRDTLYDELSAGRRARLHRRAAEAIETVHAGRAGEHVSTLAHHYSRAAAPAGETAAKAVGYAVQAGERALAQLAHDEAVAWYHRALDLIDGAGAFDEAARLDVLVALGEAQQLAGDPAHRETLLEAARTAQRLGQTDVLVKAALANTRVVTFNMALEVDADRVAALEAALEAIGDADSPERAELLAHLGLELVWAPDPARRFQCSDEAIAVARRAADPALLARVLRPRFYTIWSPETLTERLAITTELLQLAEVLGDQVLRFQGAWLRFRAALEAGDADEARRCQEITASLAEELRRPLFRWLAGWTAAGRAMLDGRIEDAVAGIDAARGIGSNLGDADIVALTQRCGVMMTGTDVPGLKDDVAAAIARTGYPNYVALLAFAQARHGDTSGAWATLAPAAGNHFATLPRDVSWAATLACAVIVVADVQDREAAEDLLRLLNPHTDQFIMAAAVPFGSVSHYVALLDTAIGDYDRADAAFATAAAMHTRMAAPAFLAATQTEWARLLLIRRNPGDAEQAADLLHQALTTARELGLAKTERDAVALLR